MAYDDYSMGGYIPGDYETEEQRRRRLLEEQAQAQAQDQENGISQQPGASRGVNLGDLASQYLGKRMDQMGQRVNDVANAVANPQQALEQRLGVPTTMPDAGNTEVQSQQVKTYADGSQEHIVKTQTPAPAPVAVAPTPMAPQPAMAPAPQPQQVQQQVQQAPAQGMAAQMAPSGPAVPTVEREAEPGTPQMSALPQAGSGVQVAGPVNPATATQPAPVVQQAPAGAPGASLAQVGQAAQAEPAWVAAANAAGNDFDKLLAVMAQHPEGGAALKEKVYSVFESKKKADEAAKLFKAAEGGDLKAWNKIQQEMRPERGKQKEEVTVGDYVRAAVYARMGLTDLAHDVQAKISGKDTKFGQVQLNGSTWTTETDAKTGEIVRAKDDEGNVATKSTIDKLSASALKTGTHAYQHIGGIHTVPNEAGTGIDLLMPVQNAQGGTAGFTYMSGPRRDEMYKGAATPQPQSIGTSYSKALNQAFVDFSTKPTTAAATEALKTAALLGNDAYNQTLAAIRSRSPEIFQQIANGQAGFVPTPATVNTTANNAGSGGVRPSGGVVSGGGQPGGAVTGGGGLLGATESTKAGVDINKQQVIDRNKENQVYSTELAKSRQSAAAQTSTISRLQSAIDRNPNFWGIDTNSAAWRAFVDVNSTNADRGESLNTLARNMNIPKEQRSAFDAVMNDYRALQVNAITGSGLTASQTNTEKESQRVMGTVGAISDRPAAAKATLEYAKAKIEYTDAKSRAWAQARKTNPGIDRLDFETNFDATTGEKIFKDANERMRNILGGPEASMDVRRQADRILGAP